MHGEGGRRRNSPDLSYRGGSSPEMSNPGRWGSIWLGIWSGMLCTGRGIDLGQRGGSAGLWITRTRSAVVLRGGVRRRVVVRVLPAATDDYV
jgi:hypothetical protein